MEPIASFSGLISGIDTQGLVDQILALESRPIARLDARIGEIQARSNAFTTFKGLVEAFESAAEKLRKGDAFSARQATTVTSSTPTPLTASAGSGAAVGSHRIEVLSLASAERLSGNDFASRTDALGLAGEFLVGGALVTVDATDSLEAVASKISEATLASGSGRVTGSVLTLSSGAHRLTLSAEETGAAGIDLVDPDGLLRSLGVLDATAAVKNATSNGARSDAFTNATATVASLLGLTSAPAGTVTIGSFTAAIDLASQSLADVAAEINTQAGAAGSSVTASVVQEVVDGKTVQRLSIAGTTSFADQDRVLDTLGVLEGGRGAVAQALASGASLQQADGSTPADGATLLTDLSVGGSPAGVQAGDTLDVSGTRGDGSTFTLTFTVAAGDTVQTLLDRLNDATDAFGAGSRTASASIDAAGKVVVTDGTAGSSQLALAIVANNEGGGTLDLGAFGASAAGRNRVLTAGADATLRVDGVFLTRSSNAVDDVVDGVTLSLLAASPGASVDLTVARDPDVAVSAAKAVVDAFNAIAAFATAQAPDANGEGGGPLAGDSTLRTLVSRLGRSVRDQVAAGVAGGLVRLADVGVEIQSDGTFTLDQEKLRSLLDSDPISVERLFLNRGFGSVSTLQNVGASDATVPGTYAVEITQAAQRAVATGSGFGGTFVDDATPDTLTVRDIGSNESFSVQLSNGDTLADIVSALSSTFATPLVHQIRASQAVASDGAGTPATAATTLADVRDSGGVSTGIADGDTFTISGKRSDGTAFANSFVASDVTTQTLGDLLAAAQAELGPDVTVSLDSAGFLQVRAQAAGSNLAELSVASDNAGGGSFTFGTIDVVQQGRAAARIEAKDSGGQLQLSHLDFGSLAGFEVSFTPGGADGTASLGLAPGTTTGVDVTGTIGGLAATGTGQLLTGDAGSAVEGLSIRFTGTTTGAVGSFTFSRGLASLIERAAEPLIGTEPGSIQSILDTGDLRIERLQDRIDDFQARLDRRRAALTERFVALEQALARSQSATQSLLSILNRFPTSTSSNG